MSAEAAADSDVVAICRDLIRIESYNFGASGGTSERKAAEYVATELSQAGLQPELLESEPGRANVVARLAGSDPSLPALLVHCHLDVVPAAAPDWSVHPLSGEIRDGFLWGRGAIDMKNMCAMVLAILRRWHRENLVPRRDIVFAFFADEETGSTLGAHWMARNHRHYFDGCTEAVGEVGGFSFTVNDSLRLYPIMTAEKGKTWLRVTARGRAGHGSMLNDNNAVLTLADAVSRLGHHRFPLRMTSSVEGFLAELSKATGETYSDEDVEEKLTAHDSIASIVRATLRNTAIPTMLQAGSNINVVPQEAEAYIDGRFLPGFEDEFHRQIDEVLGSDVEWELVLRDIALETTFDGQLVDAMVQALAAEDSAGIAVPYMLSGGTDAKAFAPLGIRCFGFSPLRLPPGLNFSALFHGIDERVPIDGLRFGERVLARFLRSA